jgi:hypothetical protein
MVVIRVGGVRATRSAPTLGCRAATPGLTRGAIVGLMEGVRAPTLRLGVRMMLCAPAGEAAKAINGRSAADRINAARRVFISQFGPS